MTRRDDPDAAILATVVGMKDFLQSSLVDDVSDDWRIAKNLGELLVRFNPEEILGHALLARACRHLGDDAQAADKIAECRKLLSHGNNPSVTALFQSLVVDEERYIQNKKGTS